VDPEKLSYSFTANRSLVRDPDQRVNIEIVIPGGMTEPAVERFAACVNDFSLALSRETSRLEEAERADVVDAPEITATLVVKANEEVRNPRQEPEQQISAWVLFAQIVAFAAAMFAGIFGSYLHSLWQWSALVGCAVLGIASQTYAILALRRRR
jgi:hypothetical protein